MARRKKSKQSGSTAWYDNWWAGADVNDDSWKTQPAGSSKPLTKQQRDDARRWAKGQRPSGGILRRLLG